MTDRICNSLAMTNTTMLLFLFLTWSLPYSANATQRHNQQRVVGLVDSDDTSTAINLVEHYGGTGNIYYVIPEHSRSLRVNLNYSYQSIPIDFNMVRVFQQAAQLWNVRREYRLVYREASETNSTEIVFHQSDYPGTATTLDTPSQGGDTLISINPSSLARDIVINYAPLIRRGAINSSISIQQYAEMYVLYAVTHELGHALGLGHPVLDENPIIGLGSWRTLVPSTRVNQSPSIMLSGTQESQNYILALSAYIGRTVCEEDIRPSVNDLEAVSIMAEARIPRSAIRWGASLLISTMFSRSYIF